MRERLMTVLVAMVAGATGAMVIDAAGVWAHGGDKEAVHACVAKGGAVRITGAPGWGDPAAGCDEKAGEVAIHWSTRGPQGPQGPPGKTVTSTPRLPPAIWATHDRINGAEPDQFATIAAIRLARRASYAVWARLTGPEYLNCALTANNNLVTRDRKFEGSGVNNVVLVGVVRVVAPTVLRLRCEGTIPNSYYTDPVILAIPLADEVRVSTRLPLP
jgi:hypothetical protein